MVTKMKTLEHRLQHSPLECLQIELTDLCHMSCVHCSTCAGPDGSHCIPVMQLKRLIGQALPLGLRYVGLSGGEPFLYPKLEDLCVFLRETGVEFSVYTCGVMVDSSAAIVPIPEEMLVQALGASRIVLSLYGSDAPIHDSITGVSGSFDAALLTALEVRRLGYALQTHFVPTARNWTCLRDVATLARELQAEELSVLRLVEQGRACGNNLGLTDQEYGQLRESIAELRQTYGTGWLRTGAPWSSFALDDTATCTAGLSKLLISAEGKVFPCEVFKFTAKLRQTFYGRDLGNIWTTDALLSAVRSARDMLPEGCAGCLLSAQCHGGCPGQRLLKTGTFRLPDPLCHLTA